MLTRYTACSPKKAAGGWGPTARAIPVAWVGRRVSVSNKKNGSVRAGARRLGFGTTACRHQHAGTAAGGGVCPRAERPSRHAGTWGTPRAVARAPAPSLPSFLHHSQGRCLTSGSAPSLSTQASTRDAEKKAA